MPRTAVPTTSTPADRPGPTAMMDSGSGGSVQHRARGVLPGLLLSLTVGAATVALSRLVPAASPALVAILLGAALANSPLAHPALQPGLDVAARTVLRAGIVLLGLQLALGDVLALGPVVIAAIVTVVAVGVGSGLLIGRLLRLPADLTVLISCGFSICGAAAVAGISGVLAGAHRDRDPERAAQHETRTATAVALVVLFGTLMIPLMPVLAHLLDLPQQTAGIWTGLSVLEVAQVVAVGSLIGDPALSAAVVVKLGRVLMLAPVAAVVTLCLRRAAAESVEGDDGVGAAGVPLIPGFILGFLVAVAVRSTGILPEPVLGLAQPAQALLLAAAMFALGTGVRIFLLRRVGGRPVVLAALVLVVVTGAGLAGALLAA
ncbi:YeiH family protein [Brachybacterium epidermidis]|uniref:YeiH family protein n=1 Tax=Brachybacterium epidermidis TaxID=2781983 RepID=UPI00398F02D1